MTSDTPQTILSSLKRFLSGTLLSRFTGLFREVTMAFAFGVTPTIASFWMAFRFANLFRRLFGEGGLNIAFIPHYENLKKQDPQEAACFFYNLSEAVTFFLFILVILAETILGSFLLFAQPENMEVLRLTMIMLPSLLFLSLFALNSALLNTEKSYFLPSAAPAIVNILWIFATLLLHYFSPKHAIEYLAISIVFAFASQWFITAIAAYRLVLRFPRKKNKESTKALLSFLRPFFLIIIGVTAQQINSAIDALFAKAADPEGPAILWYALRLQQLPFALIGVGLMNALLPPLSRTEEEGHYLNLLNFSLKKVSTFMIPTTFALFAGGFAGVNLLYSRGAFTEKATLETTLCLMAYGASLLPMAWTLLLASAFYAKKEYKIPTLCALLSMGCNICLNAFFVYVLDMKAISIAIATTIASFLNVALLVHYLSKERKGYGVGVFANLMKITLISGASAILTVVGSGLFLKDNTVRIVLQLPLFPFPRDLIMQVWSFGVTGALFLGALLILSYLFKMEEITKMISKISVGGTKSRTHGEY